MINLPENFANMTRRKYREHELQRMQGERTKLNALKAKNVDKTITKEAIEAIRTSNKLRARLMIIYDKSENTILNWIEKKKPDVRLTLHEAVNAIAEETNLPKNKIVQ